MNRREFLRGTVAGAVAVALSRLPLPRRVTPDGFDLDGFHGSSDPTRITIPPGRGGLYLLTASGLGRFVDGTYQMVLKQNGVPMVRAMTTEPGGLVGSAYLRAVPGDVVEWLGIERWAGTKLDD